MQVNRASDKGPVDRDIEAATRGTSVTISYRRSVERDELFMKFLTADHHHLKAAGSDIVEDHR